MRFQTLPAIPRQIAFEIGNCIVPGLEWQSEQDGSLQSVLKPRVLLVASAQKMNRRGDVFTKGKKYAVGFYFDQSDDFTDQYGKLKKDAMLAAMSFLSLGSKKNRKVWLLTGSHLVEVTKDGKLGPSTRDFTSSSVSKETV